MNVYEIVTKKIMQQLEAGSIPWLRPWTPADAPMNIRGTRYSGINVFLLAFERDEKGYESNKWMTFKQAMELGGDVKGQHTTLVVYASTFDGKPDKDGKSEKKYSLRYYNVFNADQVKGLQLPAPKEVPQIDPIEAAELVIKNMPRVPVIKHGGDRACYFPTRDTVQLPPRKAFKSPELYYTTAFHELSHSTAHESRLNRAVGEHVFGSKDYSKEELVAEMSSAFLMGATGIETVQVQTNTVAYIQSWLKALENDKMMVVRAASAAQKAADYILGTKVENYQSEEVTA